MNVLALNVGSNTLRYKLVASEDETTLDEGFIDGVQRERVVSATKELFNKGFDHSVDQIGVRVVHGGHRHIAPEVVTDELLEDLRGLYHLAPQHLPTDIAVIEAVRENAPRVPIVAVFDTEFHQTIPPQAARYAIGVDDPTRFRRFGFHGIAHRYVLKEVCRLSGRPAEALRLISVHLGGGASACAIQNGQSIDTSMGYTPLEGLVMSTRSGDLDPAIVMQLFRDGLSYDEVEELLNRKSGLLGLSDISADIRKLEPVAESGNEQAELALQVYGHRCRRYIGAMMAVLNGCDALVISGGLAENSPTFRQRMLRDMDGLGIEIDPQQNSDTSPRRAARISPDDAAIEVWMIPVDEELEISRSVFALSQQGG